MVLQNIQTIVGAIIKHFRAIANEYHHYISLAPPLRFTSDTQPTVFYGIKENRVAMLLRHICTESFLLFIVINKL